MLGTGGGCFFTGFDVNGKIRTEQHAESAVGTMGILVDFGEMIPFGVCPGGHEKDFFGAKLHAEAAPLAPVRDQPNGPARDAYPVFVERFSPVLHCITLRYPPGRFRSLRPEFTAKVYRKTRSIRVAARQNKKTRVDYSRKGFDVKKKTAEAVDGRRWTAPEP
jgi:hypothetical protein